MISRWVSPNGTGGADESQWQYSATIAPTKIVAVILDTGGNALAKTLTYQYAPNTFEFSTGLDQTTASEFNYQSVDQTTAQSAPITSILAGQLASTAETTYLNNAAYRSRNILGLRTSIVLKGL